MFLVVGLGNPGPKYQNHRHNVGFMVVERLAEQHSREPFREKFQGLFAKASIDSEDLGLLKPQTYMNLSGQSAQKAMAFFKIELARVIVVHDELDLPFGQVRLKKGGGEGGHNGLRDVSKALGTRDYVRVRVGIGRPPGRMDPADFVLRDFSSVERKELPFLVPDAADAAEAVVLTGLEAAQLRFHSPR